MLADNIALALEFRNSGIELFTFSKSHLVATVQIGTFDFGRSSSTVFTYSQRESNDSGSLELLMRG